MTYVAKDLKLYITKPTAHQAITQITEWMKTTEDGLKSGIALAHWSFRPKAQPWFEEIILTLRRILSKNGMLCFQDRPVSDLISMQRYMHYLEQTNLLQYILQDLTDKEIRNLQSLVQRAEKLSKTPGLDESSTLRDTEKSKLDKDLEALRIVMETFNNSIIRGGKTV